MLPLTDEVMRWSLEMCLEYLHMGKPIWKAISPVVESLVNVVMDASPDLWRDLLGKDFRELADWPSAKLWDGDMTEDFLTDLKGRLHTDASQGKGLILGILLAIEDVRGAADADVEM